MNPQWSCMITHSYVSVVVVCATPIRTSLQPQMKQIYGLPVWVTWGKGLKWFLFTKQYFTTPLCVNVFSTLEAAVMPPSCVSKSQKEFFSPLEDCLPLNQSMQSAQTSLLFFPSFSDCSKRNRTALLFISLICTRFLNTPPLSRASISVLLLPSVKHPWTSEWWITDGGIYCAEDACFFQHVLFLWTSYTDSNFLSKCSNVLLLRWEIYTQSSWARMSW